MKTILDCPCGTRITAVDEDTLVHRANEHLTADHPGLEYSRDEILMIAREGSV